MLRARFLACVMVLGPSLAWAQAESPKPCQAYEDTIDSLVWLAAAHYDEYSLVLPGGSYAIEHENLDDDLASLQDASAARLLTSYQDLYETIKTCVFLKQLPVDRTRLHKHHERLDEKAQSLSYNLRKIAERYHFYQLNNWEVTSDVWDSSGCALVIQPKLAACAGLATGIQAAKI